MLRFFRQIRQRLLTDNKFSKYLLYAIGEILLVMIGILLALQVNNWNEQQKEEDQIRKQFISLKESLLLDKDWLNNIRSVEIFKVHSFYKLIELAGESEPHVLELQNNIIEYEPSWIWNRPIPEHADSEFLKISFSWTGRERPMIPNLYSIEEFKNTGLYSKIENDALKSSINNYYGQLGWRFTSDKPSMHGEWRSSLRSDGVNYINVSNLEDPLNLIRDNGVRKALLLSLAIRAGWRADGADTLINLIDELVILIDQEISKS
ncbi:DUF6090 family protein [Robiginitalea sp. IMCC44478]|uniref:DUF6090 family protein n=1 Tax=Robiginitalea sp. IMCC44478 TaxID=3459122 RepID=UPI0040412186